MTNYIGIGNWIWDAKQNCWKSPLVSGLDLRPISEQANAGEYDGFAKGNCLVVSNSPLGSEFISIGEAESHSTALIKSAFQSALGYRPQGDTVKQLIFDLLTNGSHPDGELGVRPLMPDDRNNLKLFLPKLGCIHSERFKYGKHHHTNKIRDVERLNYRDVCHSGSNRKYLGGLGLKYSVDNPHELFIPDDLEIVQPAKPETTYSDDFNRSDSTNLGFNWVELTNDSQILSNKACCVTSGNVFVVAHWASDLSGTDATAQAIFGSNGVRGTGGVLLRKDSSGTATYYRFYTNIDEVENDPENWPPHFFTDVNHYIEKVVSGTATQLGTYSQVDPYGATTYWNTNPITSIGSANGSALKLTVNTVDMVSLTDTSITTGLRSGFVLKYSAFGSTTCEDWTTSDLGGAPTAFPYTASGSVTFSGISIASGSNEFHYTPTGTITLMPHLFYTRKRTVTQNVPIHVPLRPVRLKIDGKYMNRTLVNNAVLPNITAKLGF